MENNTPSVAPPPAPAEHPSGDQRFATLDQTIDHYHAEPTALIQVLHSAQQLFGYLKADVLRYIATRLRLPIAQVYGVVTFYHFFTMTPRGKHQILVCRGTTCHVRGAQNLLERLEQQLDLKEGETTKDNLLSLHSARCIGACALAPAISVDDDVYGKLTPDKIPRFCQKELKRYV
jgi:bidirectional [NiFe] hydrogenase diaphorase subunit